MQEKGQSAIEFLTTYSFTLLIIALVLFLLLLYAEFPKAILPTQCTLYGGFSCIDTAYFSTPSGSEFVIIASDIEPGIVNISGFTATINRVESSSGSCVPQTAVAGQNIYCSANFSTSATIGYSYAVSLAISADYCANPTGSLSNSVCSTSLISYAGDARTAGTAYTSIDLPPVQSPKDLYCVGASGGSKSVYYAQYSTSGGLGQWLSTNSYPVTLNNAGCSISNNYIYCVGASSGTQKYSYYAPVSTNGIQTWKSTTNYPITFNNAGCSTYNNYIYCVGSTSGEQSYYAPITSNGIGTWKSSTNYPVQFSDAGCSIYKGYIYCIGSNTGSDNQAYYAPISSTGIGSWQATTTYPTQLTNAGCSVYGGYIYCLGGQSGTQSLAYYAPLSSSGIGNWISTQSYPIQIGTDGCVVAGTYMYCIGSSTGSDEQVYYAPITNPGLGTWTSTNSYPLNFQGGDCSVPGTSGGYLSGGGSTT